MDPRFYPGEEWRGTSEALGGRLAYSSASWEMRLTWSIQRTHNGKENVVVLGTATW